MFRVAILFCLCQQAFCLTKPTPYSNHWQQVHSHDQDYLKHGDTKKVCPPKLSRASMLQRSMKARSLQAAGLPDPECKTGVVSLPVVPKPEKKVGEPIEVISEAQAKACCPAYCGECSDYSLCKSVRNQDSEFRCCASRVVARSCEHTRTPANICVKSCTDSVPPCIMPLDTEWVAPAMTSAAEDCNNAVVDWMKDARSAVETVEGGEGRVSGVDQWKHQSSYKLS